MRQVRRCSRAGIEDVIANTSVCADEGGDEDEEDDEDEDNHGGGDDNEEEEEDEGREEEEEPLSTQTDGLLEEMNMMYCDLCGEAKECLQKEIDGREFDICLRCWSTLEEKPPRQRKSEEDTGDRSPAGQNHPGARRARADTGCAAEDLWRYGHAQLRTGSIDFIQVRTWHGSPFGIARIEYQDSTPSVWRRVFVVSYRPT